MRFESQSPRMNCQMLFCAFSSGHFAGKSLPPDPDPGGMRMILLGMASLAEVCQPAWSTSSAACRTGAASAEMVARREAIASVLQRGRTTPAALPCLGQMAPKM